MIFSSYIFMLVFLPITLGGFVLLSRIKASRKLIAWLVICSLFFYGWWNPVYLLLIGFSIAFNFCLGLWLVPDSRARFRRGMLALGITVNLGLIAYFKYAMMVTESINVVVGSDLDVGQVVLPLAISFFTFQQIAYLVDVYQGKCEEHRFLDYCLFVTFFPQLIAGPIVHHREMLPQFHSGRVGVRIPNLTVGLVIFLIGAAKKVLIADELSPTVAMVFGAANADQPLSFAEAWLGTLAYAMQVYFDFSGYSDMAIGLARMFGIRLPVNFNSPYKSVNFVDLWRRWHITLSRFLRDYVYISLGGNRKGPARRYVNLMLAMLLGGLWHGASWTFVVFGALQGAFLVINQAWAAIRSRSRLLGRSYGLPGLMLARGLTFTCFVGSLALFRADSFRAGYNMLKPMFGVDGFDMALGDFKRSHIYLMAVLLGVVWFLPNTQQIMRRYRPALGRRPVWRGLPIFRNWQWHPDAGWGVIMALLAIAILLHLSRVSEFIYYRF